MIQRIQSLYLLLAFILATGMFFFDWVVYNMEDGQHVLSAFNADTNVAGSVLPFLNACLAVVIGVTIFLYKNRSLQMRNTTIAIGLCFLLFGDFAVTHYLNIIGFQKAGDLSMSYKPATIFPLLILVFLWLAHRFIKKDDDLVKSADRLR
jgi:hypothetical protein